MPITRRSLLGGIAGAAAVSAAAHAAPKPKAKPMAYKNEDFYTNGKFNEEAAKKAYFEMMDRFKYPIPESLRTGMWVLDFGLGRFTDVGMAGIFWLNSKEGAFLGHEIYLLPGQMIAEHWHEKTADGPAKNEGWHLRYGDVCLFGEGDPTPALANRIPASERKFCTVSHGTLLKPGEVAPLTRLLSRHFMVAGAPGAIVSEYASYHDMAGLHFSNPNAKL